MGTSFVRIMAVFLFQVAQTQAAPQNQDGMQLPDGMKQPTGIQPPNQGNPNNAGNNQGQKLPDGFQLPPGMKIPEGFQIPEGLEIPDDFEIPEGFQLPEGFELPKDFKIPPGMKIPPGLKNFKFPAAANSDPLAGLTLDNMFHNLPNNSVFGLAGTPTILNCNVPAGTSEPVIWTRPGDHEIVVYDSKVIPAETGRLQVMADQATGAHKLIIRYTEFPRDNGTWTCKQFGGEETQVMLVILSPPPVRIPDITPTNASVIDASKPWTFTCVGQFAFPPVELKWVRISGPDVGFTQTPPNYVTSFTTKAMSTSIKLLVTPENSGSTFACHSRHPTFKGKVYSSEVSYGMPRADAIVQLQPTRPSLKLSSFSLDKNDLAMVITVCTIGALVFVIGASMYKGRAGWELDVRPRIDYVRVPTSDVEANGITKEHPSVEVVIPNGKPKSHHTCSERDSSAESTKRAHRKCIIKVVIGSIFSVLLLLSLGVAIPLYLKGVTPPKLGTDTMTSVVAGSALWLDCSGIATPTDSVSEITWLKDGNKFYHQSLVMAKNTGFADNSTLGRQFGMRISSNWLAQINIWPMLPGEGGVYSCHVTLAGNNQGETTIKTFSYGVFVITGLMINTALLAVLGTALICAVGLVSLAFYHSMRCATPSHRDAT